MSRLLHKLEQALVSDHVNAATAFLKHPLLPPEPPCPFDARALFVAGWPAIDRALDRHRSTLGLCALVLDAEGALLAEGWVEAALDRTQALIVGRHLECSARVPPEFAEVSLRHLAILVRAESLDQVGVRVLDLHTGRGFGDERGRALEAVRLSGPAFLSVAGLRIALLVTGDLIRSHDPLEMYAQIPERVFFDEREGRDRAWSIARLRDEGCAEETRVVSCAGPIAATGRLTLQEESPAGVLTLTGRGMTVTREIGPQALARGILIGRYSRCDVRTGEDSDRVSRVHALVVEAHGEVLVVDTASSNGTWVLGREVEVARLTRDVRAELGRDGEGLQIRWLSMD